MTNDERRKQIEELREYIIFNGKYRLLHEMESPYTMDAPHDRETNGALSDCHPSDRGRIEQSFRDRRTRQRDISGVCVTTIRFSDGISAIYEGDAGETVYSPEWVNEDADVREWMKE